MKEYLGDSVYVEMNKWNQLVLTTDNGEGPSNTIILEPDVAIALVKFLERITA